MVEDFPAAVESGLWNRTTAMVSCCPLLFKGDWRYNICSDVGGLEPVVVMRSTAAVHSLPGSASRTGNGPASNEDYRNRETEPANGEALKSGIP